jgi:hypothetical protein
MMNIATKGAAKEYADGKILSSVSDGIGILTFNNPEKRNAMSVKMWEGAAEVLTAFRDDPNVRVVVLVGAGGKAFVSGADISQFEKNRRSIGHIRAHGTGNAPHGASESVASLVMSTEIVGHRGCRGQALRRSSRRRRRRRLDAVALARRGWLLGRCPSLADYVRGPAATRAATAAAAC